MHAVINRLRALEHPTVVNRHLYLTRETGAVRVVAHSNQAAGGYAPPMLGVPTGIFQPYPVRHEGVTHVVAASCVDASGNACCDHGVALLRGCDSDRSLAVFWRAIAPILRCGLSLSWYGSDHRRLAVTNVIKVSAGRQRPHVDRDKPHNA